MHAVLRDNLERYLSGTLDPAAERELEGHLRTCNSCCEEALALRELSAGLATLRSEVEWQPDPSFYASVMQRVDERRSTGFFDGIFAFDFDFARRLALTSALTLVVLGGYLVSREMGSTQGPLPVAMMAQQESPDFDSAPGPEAMLATLTAYVR
jgi:anti-sigma factor RsiW